jgi:hypothetical protein
VEIEKIGRLRNIVVQEQVAVGVWLWTWLPSSRRATRVENLTGLAITGCNGETVAIQSHVPTSSHLWPGSCSKLLDNAGRAVIAVSERLHLRTQERIAGIEAGNVLAQLVGFGGTRDHTAGCYVGY